MVKSLLKRKLKIVNLKKLKTIGYRFTSLSQWAKKQLSKKQSTYLSLSYPRNLILKRRLHRKQLLSQLVGNFSFSQTGTSLHDVSSAVSKQSTVLGQQLKTKEIVVPRKAAHFNAIGDAPSGAFVSSDPCGQAVGLGLKAAQAHLSENPKPSKLSLDLLHDIQPVLSDNVPLGAKPNQIYVPGSSQPIFPSRSSKWPLYLLKRKSTKNGAKIHSSNWKSLYSLDQLMCHQYDAQKQFVRRDSRLKSSLREKQKLRALYGKISKKQWKKWFKKNDTAHKPSHVVTFLESRLDIALKRCFVFNTLRHAQHWINQGRILVNQKAITSPSHILQPGDVVSLGEVHKNRYKSQFLDLFYRMPKESKYIQSGRLLNHWRDWAALYNNLGQHYQKTPQRKNPFVKSTLPGARAPRQGLDKMRLPWPDLAIQNFWYQSGRAIFKCLYKHRDGDPTSLFLIGDKSNTNPPICKTLGVKNLVRWLRRKRWLMASLVQRKQARRQGLRFHFTHWKDIYRRRILLFSRWLLSANPLIRDGLYFLRWHRGFIRKKSIWLKASHRQCALEKGLHFEVSYKKLCAIYLYPAQRILLPCLIDFRKI